MGRKTLTNIAAALGALALTAPVAAQEAPAAGTEADTPEMQQRALENLQILFAGLSSEDVDQRMKDVLVGCLYQNSLRQITMAMDDAVEQSGAELDRSDRGRVLGLMAGVCGFQPEQPATEGR